jgi:DNA polymerase-3 subunit epsilon
VFATVAGVDRSFDDLGTPLHEVTFCVVDLETTGASAAVCDITEVGAARFRGGECLGTFQTLVNPAAPLDPAVRALTGITDAMLRPAPPVSAVLPTLAEFVGGSVLVGHNLRFDVSFLDAALTAGDRSPVGLRTVDTVALARRLVRDEVPDCRLGTLAHHLGLDHVPTHRALDDVLATADLLHLLLERAATFGVTVLDDLLQLPRLAAHPHAGKLRLTNRLPRAPGVYVLRDGQGEALHVGRADDDLRRRVRSLFSGDD